ncbi:thermonuclease family protein [Marinococcus luteus]|uniref:thermonuclease family protein n=1 Tax=Marinococcus luteus TaxID=1122204 RepID=UPI002ACCFE3D|nr:thermonuclease family protein [Marinococcus luteus]MDZ5782145.1 thermonuclease family protein [Marinococcus luteus]
MKKPVRLLSSTLALTLFLTACSEESGEESGSDTAEEQTNEQTSEEESTADTEEQTEENNESADDEAASGSENDETTEEQQPEDASNTEEASNGNSSEDSESTDEEASADAQSDSDAEDTNATVTNIVDGDTIDVDYEGGEERIRLILVDTPETKHPQMDVQPFGPEATEFTTSVLEGEDVRLELGVEERDYYGRLLAYVFVDGENFNQQLIEEGLARVAVYPPNTEYLDEFEAAEEEARSAGIGIWSLEDYVTDDGYEEQDDESQDSPGESGSSDSGESSEDVYYENCDAARDAGADPVREDDPGYGGHLDRDGDGVGCET